MIEPLLQPPDFAKLISPFTLDRNLDFYFFPAISKQFMHEMILLSLHPYLFFHLSLSVFEKKADETLGIFRLFLSSSQHHGMSRYDLYGSQCNGCDQEISKVFIRRTSIDWARPSLLRIPDLPPDINLCLLSLLHDGIVFPPTQKPWRANKLYGSRSIFRTPGALDAIAKRERQMSTEDERGGVADNDERLFTPFNL